MQPPDLRTLASTLLKTEAAQLSCAPSEPQAAAAVLQKLRASLVVFLGSAGYTALLGRALALAKRDDPSLATLQLEPDGSLKSPAAPPAPTARSAAPAAKPAKATGAGLIITHLLDLLVTFIGEPLTLQLVGQAAPPAGPVPLPEDNP